MSRVTITIILMQSVVAMTRLVAEIQRFLQDHQVVGRGIVAVSGGADSVALLLGLRECHGDGLVIGHFNHRLRGDESDGDEQFVRELGKQLGVPVRVGSGDVKAAGSNLEAAARKLRYHWFVSVAQEVGARWVATGHTADDQAETVLHRIIRGTGITGLSGIAKHRPLCGEIQLIRPLLTVTRQEILMALAGCQQHYRIDSTNNDSAFTRNRIRHELLPLLKTFNPQVVEALTRLAEQARSYVEEHQPRIALLLEGCELPRAGERVILDAAGLSRIKAGELQELFRAIWLREGWPQLGMSAAHWARLVEIATGRLTAADFPGGITARRLDKVVQLGRHS